jgi:hypothetical protein
MFRVEGEVKQETFRSRLSLLSTSDDFLFGSASTLKMEPVSLSETSGCPNSTSLQPTTSCLSLCQIRGSTITLIGSNPVTSFLHKAGVPPSPQPDIFLLLLPPFSTVSSHGPAHRNTRHRLLNCVSRILGYDILFVWLLDEIITAVIFHIADLTW